MRKLLFATSMLVSAPVLAQSIQTGSLGGMDYYLLPASGGCFAATPCSVVTYLSYQSESAGATQQDLTSYFGGVFAQQNPHTIVIAPVENGPQDTAVNWGGYDGPTTTEQAQMVAIVKSVEASMGNAVNSKDSIVTGGSLGGTGTQAALISYGPNGQVQPGVFSAGLSFDAADYSAANNPSQVAALCGVPLMAVHGTADTNQNISYDQNLQSAINGNPACHNSFTLVPIQGHGHGTWSDPSVGYGSSTPAAFLTSMIQSLSTGTANPSTQAATVSSKAVTGPSQAIPTTRATQQLLPTIESATIMPGAGSITDDQGNVWTITASGSIMENNQYTPGGGGTSALTIVNGVVYGQDNGHDGNTVNPGGWFILNGDGQYWEPSDPPGTAGSSASASNAASASALVSAISQISGPTCGGAAAAGNFTAVNGQIYTPNGKLFIASGINEQPGQQASAAQLQALFPGINFVRYALDYTQPVDEAYINSLTAAGIVVDVEDHPWPTPGVYSGSQLQQEAAWYAQLATDFKNNPNVWFGTMNEPSGASPAGIEPQEATIYDAVRGTGNTNMVLLELYGGGNPGTIGLPGGMTQGPYSNMTNVAWDLHFYPWATNNSTDPGTIAAAIINEVQQAQTITGRNGSTIPVVIGEFGNSTDGQTSDGASGSATVQAVINSGYGFAAWQLGLAGGNIDNLVTGSSLTDYGQVVSKGISNNHAVASQCSAEAGVTPINTIPPTTGSGSGALTPINSLSSIPAPGG